MLGRNMLVKKLTDLDYVEIIANKIIAKGLEPKQTYLFNHFKTDGHRKFFQWGCKNLSL